jgi:DNA-binding transcriptional LysR family regulator
MELRQLEYFVAVAEEANFTRAAERVHISQSGVSAQIRRLERELGAELLDRNGRGASLTAAGTAALAPARAALAAAGAVRRSVDEVTGLVRGSLTVGMVTGCTITPLFDALAAFRDAHPGVDLVLTEASSDQLLAGVRDGTVDLGLVGTAGLPEGLRSLPIVSERLVAVVPAAHPLARRRSARLASLAGHPLISMPVGTGIRAVFDQACAAAGVQPAIALQASAPAAVADLASRGLGVGILSESMLTARTDELVGRRIEDVETPAVLALVWRELPHPALAKLVARCAQAFGRPEEET